MIIQRTFAALANTYKYIRKQSSKIILQPIKYFIHSLFLIIVYKDPVGDKHPNPLKITYTPNFLYVKIFISSKRQSFIEKNMECLENIVSVLNLFYTGNSPQSYKSRKCLCYKFNLSHQTSNLFTIARRPLTNRYGIFLQRIQFINF